MRIATVLIMIAAIATIIIAPALVGMVVGILIAFLFVLNAKENGGKGLQ